MSDAAKARAEARRKAILSRGTDRLAKITSSARGEDAAAYMHDDPPLAPLPNRPGLEEFVGESSSLPIPPTSSRNVRGSSQASPFQAAGLGSTSPDPSVWSEEQQAQLLHAILGGGPNASRTSEQTKLPLPSNGQFAPSASSDDPLAALMSSMQQFGGPPGFMPPGAAVSSPPQIARPKSKSLLQKLMPFVHFLAAWALLAYFVIMKEPEAYDAKTHSTDVSEGRWRRWADLSWKNPEDGWGVQAVPFFWGFTTLTIVLHSWRIFSKLDSIQPPMLLSLAISSLPPPIPSIIMNGLKYLQIGAVFLDDVSGLLVGVGLLVWIAGWATS